ncbi:hypothetical protein BJY59DRAFT_287439 [Rhodotorula toruloides]
MVERRSSAWGHPRRPVSTCTHTRRGPLFGRTRCSSPLSLPSLRSSCKLAFELSQCTRTRSAERLLPCCCRSEPKTLLRSLSSASSLRVRSHRLNSAWLLSRTCCKLSAWLAHPRTLAQLVSSYRPARLLDTLARRFRSAVLVQQSFEGPDVGCRRGARAGLVIPASLRLAPYAGTLRFPRLATSQDWAFGMELRRRRGFRGHDATARQVSWACRTAVAG